MTGKKRQVLVDRNVDINLDDFLKLNEEKKELTTKVDNLRQQRNAAAKEKDIERGKEIKEKLGSLEEELRQKEEEYNNLLLKFPNVPLDDVPVGPDETGNKVLRKWGEPRQFDFPVKDHVEIGEKLDIIDIEDAGKVVGSRFAYLKAEAAMLQFALINFTFQTLQDQKILSEIAQKVSPNINPKPFIPVIPPVMIKPEVYTRMGRLDPSVVDERYYLPKDDLYLIGSAEHTLGPLHMDQVLEEGNLPIRYVGYSTSFRREAGAYGKDVRGILRVHQFDKIEMETFSRPEDSQIEQDFIVAIQEYLVKSLGIPYQVVIICTGDMTTPDARQIDIECWIPSQNRYRETHTSDLMTDYQARRLNTRVRRKDGKIEFVHMNDATAFAIGRILIAILENFQQKDGSVKIPEVLQKYTGFAEIKPKK
ncbi:MAG: serine--tRNA ligase [Patescibacteria group bacterium]|nr:serine--tRNA ligase [Patescibacteria group bacterium]